MPDRRAADQRVGHRSPEDGVRGRDEGHTAASAVAVPNLLYNGMLVTAETYRPLEVYTIIAIIYFVLLFPHDAARRAAGAALKECARRRPGRTIAQKD